MDFQQTHTVYKHSFLTESFSNVSYISKQFNGIIWMKFISINILRLKHHQAHRVVLLLLIEVRLSQLGISRHSHCYFLTNNVLQPEIAIASINNNNNLIATLFTFFLEIIYFSEFLLSVVFNFLKIFIDLIQYQKDIE